MGRFFNNIRNMDNKTITVTSPLLPNLDEFNEMLKEIWASKWITNNGTGISEEFVKYALPLIQGDPECPKEDGLPRFARLKKVLVEKR